jgi:trigger factor
MQVSLEDVSALTKTLTVVVPEDVVAKKIKASFRKLKSDVSIKGFRKGKVPQKVLEKNYGDSVKMEVGEKLVQDTYFEAIEKVECEPVVHPDIKSHEFADDGTFVYSAEIDVKPEFELADYKGLEVELPKIEVSDEDIDAGVENLRKEMAPLQNVDERAIVDDDLVLVDFQGYDDGEEMKQVGGENYSLEIGTGRNGKEFEEACLGMSKDEETSKDISFPADFPNPVLAGKTVEFKIKVRDIKERVLAEIDDDFAQDVGEDFKTVAELREHVSKNILKEKKDARSGDLTDKVMMKILENHQFEVPNRLVAQEVSEQIKQLESHLEKQGMTLETAGLSQDKLVKEYREGAAKRVRGDFIIKKIAEKEEIKLSEDDVNSAFERVSKQYGMPVDEVKKYFRNRDDMLPFMNELLSEKILDFLRENTVINEVEA